MHLIIAMEDTGFRHYRVPKLHSFDLHNSCSYGSTVPKSEDRERLASYV